MSLPLFTPVVCPVCRGKKRSLDRVMSCPFPFPVVLDPAYLKLPAGDYWGEELYVCAACMGSGMRSDALARILSGEFHAATWMQPLTVK